MTLFKLRGIPIRLHSSFLVLGGLYLVLRGLNAGADAAIMALVHAFLVFAFVFLHELGHAGAAAAFGIRTQHITLYPFGGAAAMQVDPGKPRIETWIALAGPMVNGLLAAILFPLAWAGVPGTLTAAWINLGLGLFNLIPAYPMDGGRILRARLVLRHGVRTGTLRALGVARFIGWLAVAAGLYTDSVVLWVGVLLLVINRSERGRWSRTPESNQSEPRSSPTDRHSRQGSPTESPSASLRWAHPVPSPPRSELSPGEPSAR